MKSVDLIRIFVLIAVIALLSGCVQGGADATPTAFEGERVDVLLPVGYIPNIQFSPLYVALEKGYFEEAGFNVSLDYRFETDGVALVGQGAIPFAIASGEQVLLARAQGIPVKYAMSWFQNFPVGVAVKADSGIDTPQDLVGKQVGLPGLFGANYIGLRALLSAAGVEEGDITLESIGFNQVEALAADQVDAVVVYVTNEPIQLRARGYEVIEFPVSDYVHLVGNGIITNEDLLQEDPDMVQRFIDAFLRGLKDTISDPEEAYQISLNYVENLEEADYDIQKEVIDRSIDYWQSDPLGSIDQDGWENMVGVLLEMGLLTDPVPAEEAFTNQFVGE